MKSFAKSAPVWRASCAYPSRRARIGSGLEILRERDQRLAPVITELKALARAGQLAVPLSAFAMICAHMFANRLLRSAQEEQEPVIYDFLSRIYLSEAARARRS